MILFLAQKITSLFIQNGAEKEDREVYEYGLLIILSNLITVSVLLLLAVLLGIIKEMFCFLTVFISVRHFAGGYHAKRYQSCFVISLVSCLLLVYAGKYLYVKRGLALVLLLVSSAVIFCLAPVRPKEQVLKEDRAVYHKKMSRRACSLCLAIFILLYWLGQYYWAGFIVTALMLVAIALLIGKAG